MLEKLREIEKDHLWRLLCDTGHVEWRGLLVDYHHPYVWRLWTQFDEDHRVFLHKIHPCEPGEALLHPHPWPSAMRVFTPEGTSYETGTAYAWPGTAAKPVCGGTFYLQTGSCYEMVKDFAWHYVRPIGGPIYSLMVVGRPYKAPKQERFGQNRVHKPIDADQVGDLLAFFRKTYAPPA